MLSINDIRVNAENRENAVHVHGQKNFISNQRVTRARAALDEKVTNITNPCGMSNMKHDEKPTLLKAQTKLSPVNVDVEMSIVQPSAAECYIQSRDSLRQNLINEVNDHLAFTAIDEQDAGNDLMMTYYVNEIFDYLCVRELSKLPLEKDFLEKADAKFTPRMRYVVVDWLVQVSVKFQLLPETVYLCVAILDRIFSLNGSSITNKELQLFGITALYLASKCEEIYPPDIADFVVVTDGAFKEPEIRRTELLILEDLDFYLSIPLPIIFLRRYSRLAELDTVMHSAAKFFLELTMQEYNLCYLPSNLRAASAVSLAIMLFSTMSADASESWTIPLQFHSGLKPTDLQETIQIIAAAVFRQHAQSKFRAIYKKYKEEDAGAISVTPQMSSELLRRIANC